MPPDRLRVFVPALVAIVLLLVTATTFEWFVVELPAFRGSGVDQMVVSLRDTRSMASDATFWMAIAFAVTVAIQAGARVFTDHVSPRFTRAGYVVGVSLFGTAVMAGYLFGPDTGHYELAMLDFELIIVERTWAPALMLAGTLSGMVALYYAGLEENLSTAILDPATPDLAPARALPPRTSAAIPLSTPALATSQRYPRAGTSNPPANSTIPPLRPATLSRPATIPPSTRPATIPPPSRPATIPPSNVTSQRLPRASTSTPPANRPATIPPSNRPGTIPPSNRAGTVPPTNRAGTIPPTNRAGTIPPTNRAGTIAPTNVTQRLPRAGTSSPPPIAARTSTSKLAVSRTTTPTAMARTTTPVHRLRGKLRYAALTAQLTRGGVDALREDGSTVLVVWRDVVGAVARRLPDELDGETIVDLVSTAGSTIRITPWTRLEGDPVTGEDRALAFIQYILGRCPDLSIDPATRAFLEGSEAAQLPDVATLAAHDGRLA